jgi:hypothetical protein
MDDGIFVMKYQAGKQYALPMILGLVFCLLQILSASCGILSDAPPSDNLFFIEQVIISSCPLEMNGLFIGIFWFMPLFLLLYFKTEHMSVDFYRRGIYVFIRQRTILNWYFKKLFEIVQLIGLYLFVYSAVYLLWAESFFSNIIGMVHALRQTGAFYCTGLLFYTAVMLSANLLSIRLGSHFAIVLSIGLIIPLYALGIVSYMNFPDPAAIWTYKLNPVVNVIVPWHTYSETGLWMNIPIYNPPDFSLVYSGIYLLILNIAIIVLGLRYIQTTDICLTVMEER